MKVWIKEFSVGMEIKNNGIVLDVYDGTKFLVEVRADSGSGRSF